jgi:hypothetical protein
MTKKTCAATGIVVAALGGALLMGSPANAGDLNINSNNIENSNSSTNSNTNENSAGQEAEEAAATP